jgi:hypothetical protein
VKFVRFCDVGAAKNHTSDVSVMAPIVGHLRPEDRRTTDQYRYAPHKDVSVNDGPHIRRWSHNIIILRSIIQYYILVLQLPAVFSTATCCTGL